MPILTLPRLPDIPSLLFVHVRKRWPTAVARVDGHTYRYPAVIRGKSELYIYPCADTERSALLLRVVPQHIRFCLRTHELDGDTDMVKFLETIPVWAAV